MPAESSTWGELCCHVTNPQRGQALERKRVAFDSRPFKFDGVFEAKLMAMACGEPSEGRARQAVRLLAAKAVELDIADWISPTSVHLILKN
jgi:hypothetical protein